MKRSKYRQKEAQQKTFSEDVPESDETFAFIAGYTSGGAPYGITWEEWAEEIGGDASPAKPPSERGCPFAADESLDDIFC